MKSRTRNNFDFSKPDSKFYNIPFEISSFNGMPYRTLGKSGLNVPNVGLGTWKIGYPETGDKSRVNEKEALKLLDEAVELGVTLWDTANRYNNASGNSERIIGTWLKNNPDQRRNVIVATKLGGAMDGITPNHCGLSRQNIIEAVYASLNRLQTDYIDLLYFHAFDPITPIAESMAAVEDLIRNDLIRYFAVSNFTVDQIKAYQSVQKEMTIRSNIVAIQNRFDILEWEREPYQGVMDYVSPNGISFIAWGPLARGLLSDRYLTLQNIGPGDRLYDEEELKNDSNIPHNEKLRSLSKLAEEWGIKLSQLVLAYMLTLPAMGPVIPSSSNIEQLKLNAAAGKMKLNKERIIQIEEVLKQHK